VTDHDATTDPALRSWVAGADGSDRPIQSLPYCAFALGTDAPRLGVGIGPMIVDLGAVARAGHLDGTVADPAATLGAPNLNPLLAQDRAAWRRLRARLGELLRSDADDRLLRPHLVSEADVTLQLPFAPGDYVDFYSSLEHASAVGRMFRPDDPPLLPNWRWIPIAYHGRAGTVVVSGTDIRRPVGQRRPAPDEPPSVGPTRTLDIELELGFVLGGPTPLGTPVPIDRAADHIFGVVLVNDWSARDIQAWEYRPLGPFLGKSFATSVSAWVVPWDSLAPHRVEARAQEPPPLPYLGLPGAWALDVQLRVDLAPADAEPTEISAVNARGLYWSAPQQVAHLASNGASIRAGDLIASGTISGEAPEEAGSLLERTWNGARPMRLAGGVQRTFLEDGDAVTLRGWAGGDGAPRIGLGSVVGRVLPAAGPGERR
jgi:fumarylacetoacetase